jgi:phosphate/sulfate permease
LFAAGATVAAFLLAQRPGRHWFDAILFVGYFVGTAVSGNAHAPNDAVVWVTVFLVVGVIAGTLAAVGAAVSHRFEGRQAERNRP